MHLMLMLGLLIKRKKYTAVDHPSCRQMWTKDLWTAHSNAHYIRTYTLYH